VTLLFLRTPAPQPEPAQAAEPEAARQLA